MKLQGLTAFGLSSSLILASFGATLLIPSQSFANPSQDQILAQKVAVLRSGDFVTVEQDHPTTGQARIITENGKRYLELDSRFGTATGPDVQIILYRRQNVPQKISERDYITLAMLKSFDGAQRYEIPDNIDIDDFQSVGIWCRQFNVTFGYATL